MKRLQSQQGNVEENILKDDLNLKIIESPKVYIYIFILEQITLILAGSAIVSIKSFHSWLVVCKHAEYKLGAIFCIVDVIPLVITVIAVMTS